MKKCLFVLSLCVLCCLFILALSVTPVDARGSTVCICHIPPGNPDNAHTICIGESAVRAHLRHGDTMGECPVVCDAASDCHTGQFCKRDDGVCAADAKGVCTAIPVSCPTILAPVCGCDGTTYDNSCLANAAGVTVQQPGACVVPGACGGSSGATCEDGQFCKHEDGACEPDASGICADIPNICPRDYRPVCGCDDVTYSNACYADVAGVAVLSDGACAAGATCGGTDGATCGAGQFCKPRTGDCTEIAEGDCAPIPPLCSLILAPVCGCDGMIYDNACLADAASVGVAHTGVCAGDEHACGGTGGATCGTGEFCSRPEGECAADAAGVCHPIPANCPAILAPVCGCNDTTYSNACIADAAGVTIKNDGPCEPTLACGSGSGLTCSAGRFCKGEVGACEVDAAGVCARRPLLCPPLLSPVCGCDGTTYSNSCVADAAGVTVSHTGACATLR